MKTYARFLARHELISGQYDDTAQNKKKLEKMPKLSQCQNVT